MKHTGNYNPKSPSFLRRSLTGYLRFFRGILWFALAVGLVVLTGFLIVYPLWYFASGYRNAYSLFALGVLLLALALALAGRLRSSVRGAGGFMPWLKTRFFRAARKVLCVLLAAGVLYALFFLFAHGYILPAAAGTLVYLVFLGVVLARRRESL
ncbi:MAG: hypothetical protein FWG35_02415 [Spirochaetaceae bacterium]|nr:hypothetical protein [Spirochaetaceae bacterium]